MEGANRAGAHIAEPDVDAACEVEGPFREPLDRAWIGNIGSNPERACADLPATLGNRFKCVRVACGQDELRTFARERFGGGFANAARRSRDDDDEGPAAV